MSGEKSKCIESYKNALLWEDCLTIAQEYNLPDSEIIFLAKELVESLMEKSEFKSASTILKDYVADIAGSVQALVKGNYWVEALRQSQLYKKSELISTVINPGLVDGMSIT